MSTVPSPSSTQLTSDKLQQLYTLMLKYRLVVRAQRAAPGLEAVLAGALVELDRDDIVIPGDDMLPPIVRSSGIQEASAMPTVHAAADVASQFALANGSAIALSTHSKPNVVIAYWYAEKLDAQKFAAQVRYAALARSSVVFITISRSPSSGDGREIEGVPSFTIDASDVIAVYRTAQECIYRARIGAGPSVIDCKLLPEGDALAHLEAYMRAKGCWDAEWRQRIERDMIQRMRGASSKKRA